MSSSKAQDIDWKDTNVGAIGSEEDKALRKKVAATEPAWAEAGKVAGVQVWRIEKFHVVASPEGQEGKFHTGDSYIVLKTEEGEGGVKIYSIHFWIGAESSQDEYGSAAYKTVELDDFFDGEPSQHREVQGEESDAFKALFDNLEYLDGGMDSGFKHVVKEGFNEKMFVVRKLKGKPDVTVQEVPLVTKVLNPNDSFILSAENVVYVLEGPQSEPAEKLKANQEADKIADGRACETTRDIDDNFWKVLHGQRPPWCQPKAAPVAEAPKAAPAASGKNFTLQELKDGCPDGVDPAAKEAALSDSDFQAAFKMSRDDFAKLPGWKQKAAKKDVGLF